MGCTIGRRPLLLRLTPAAVLVRSRLRCPRRRAGRWGLRRWEEDTRSCTVVGRGRLYGTSTVLAFAHCNTDAVGRRQVSTTGEPPSMLATPSRGTCSRRGCGCQLHRSFVIHLHVTAAGSQNQCRRALGSPRPVVDHLGGRLWWVHYVVRWERHLQVAQRGRRCSPTRQVGGVCGGCWLLTEARGWPVHRSGPVME